MPFHLCVHDNHSWMVGSCDRLFPESGCPACSLCGFRTDREFTAINFSLRQKRYDISCCYDGAIIASRRFVEVCTSLGAPGLFFEPLPRAPGFFHLKHAISVKLDYEAMGTERKRMCSACGIYRDFTGHRRLVLKDASVIPENGLAFSDEYFGSNNEASPLLLIGDLFYDALKATKVNGIASIEPLDK